MQSETWLDFKFDVALGALWSRTYKDLVENNSYKIGYLKTHQYQSTNRRLLVGIQNSTTTKQNCPPKMSCLAKRITNKITLPKIFLRRHRHKKIVKYNAN